MRTTSRTMLPGLAVVASLVLACSSGTGPSGGASPTSSPATGSPSQVASLPATSPPATSAPSASTAVSTPENSSSPVADAVVDAFLTNMTDPTLGGSATITGTLDTHQRNSEVQTLTGSLTWRGSDVDQVLYAEPAGMTIGSYTEAIVLGQDTFVLSCPAPDCIEHLAPPYFQEAYWSAVPDPGAAAYSLIALLQGGASFGHAGSEILDGRSLERLVAIAPVDQPAAFGSTGYFGRPSTLDGFSASLTVLVDADGLPVVIRAEATRPGLGYTATMTLEATITDIGRSGDSSKNQPSAPPPSRTLAFVDTGHGYEFAVPADWQFVAGEAGGVDRFIAPSGSDRLEIRVYLEPQYVPIDEPATSEGLKDVFEQLYGVRPSSGGNLWLGAVNAFSVAANIEIDGVMTRVMAGPLYWAGCPGGGSGCTNAWSLLEMRSKPGNEDLDRYFLNRLSQTFVEDAAQP